MYLSVFLKVRSSTFYLDLMTFKQIDFYFFLKVGLGLSNAKRYQFISLFILAIIFALVFIKTLAEHFDLILRNQTFLETLRAPEFTIDGLGKNGFDIGRRKNFEQVFGVRRRYWFLPVFTR